MANFVTPPVPLRPAVERIIEFKGLNHKTYVEEGEMSDMLNLTSDNYPLLTPRKPRGRLELPADIQRPLQITSRYGKICIIARKSDESYAFFFDGSEVTSVTGLNENSRMVVINSKLCFFPQKTYIEIIRDGRDVRLGDFGALAETVTASPLTITIASDHCSFTQAGTSLKAGDALSMTGTLAYTESGTQRTASADLSFVIDEVSGSTIKFPAETFLGTIPTGITSVTLTGSIERKVPDMDFVIEWNNRLWGCSSEENTIFACKLGDPTNWQYYQGTSMDSFYAQQGTDEDWTGVAPYSNHLIFFKQNSMTRVYGTAPSNFQTQNTKVYGVEAGSSQSVVVINDRVFYKSTIGIMCYDGGIPYQISEKLNHEFKNVVGGTEGRKYYASCQIKNGGYALYVLDIDKALWHKEDRTRYRGTTTIDNKLYYIAYDDDILYCDVDVICDPYLLCGGGDVTGGVGIVNPANPTEEYKDISWMAVFGPFDEYIEEHKIYSKLALRFKVNDETNVRVYISINEGEWELVKEFDDVKTHGEVVPIIPRRCDRYSVKIEGTGNCEIKSLTRRYRQGTFGKL